MFSRELQILAAVYTLGFSHRFPEIAFDPTNFDQDLFPKTEAS